MIASAGVPATGNEWTNRWLLFAQQPDPDLDFTDEDLDETMPPPPPMKEPKQSGKRPLLWIVLLLLLGGIGYVAMDPDGAMQLVAPYLEDGQETAQPAAQRPSPRTPSPATVPSETVEAGTPASLMTPPSTPVTPTAKAAPPVVNVAGPLFSEGQRVTVVADPSRPKSPVPLLVDSVGTNTGTTLPVSTTLIVLDGDYQKNGWVYAVRTQNGRKGWIPERNLKLKR
ncbi:MAG: hypothetical protein OJF47_001427 [Nitrospira sp.]|jgi:hypothetical protein|nr:MAG: hypothetical protein OJF47_001427 [Nitrospira sp.]